MKILSRRILKPLLIGFAVLLAFYVTIYLLGAHYLTNSAISQRIAQGISAKLQRQVTVSDKVDFKVTWDLRPRLVIHDVTIANLPNSKQANMLTVGTIEAEIRLVSLLFKDFHIAHLKLIKPDIYLETINGVNNWDFSEPEDSKDSDIELSIDYIDIESGQAVYVLNGVLRHKLRLDSFSTKIEDDFEKFIVNTQGSFNELPLDFAGEFERNDNKTSVTVDKFQLNKINLTGELSLQHDPRLIKGELVAYSFSLNDVLGADNSKSSNGQYTLPTKEFPIANLQDNTIDINIKIKKFTYNKLVIDNLNLFIKTQNNVVNAGLKPAINIAGGIINLDMTYDLNQAIPKFTFNLKSTPLNLQTLLDLVLDKSPISGSNLSIESNLVSNGTNLDAIVANSDGKILLTASPGVYIHEGSNLFSGILTALITFKKTDPNTNFSCAVMNFKVNNGMAVANNGIALEAASVNVLGNGQVNLRNGNINFSIMPQNTSNSPIDLAQFSAAQAITITGTISQPQISFNPIGLISSSPAVTGIAAIASMPVGIATLAKQLVDPDKSNNVINPCKTALGN